MKRRMTALLAATALAASAVPALATGPASAAPGDRSIAKVLTSDSNRFDRNAADYDILTEAVLAVIAAKPDSPVAVLADGTQRLTVFAPTDQAFRLLVRDLTGKNLRKERKVFRALVSAAGVDTIEAVLLYHVVPGVRLTSPKVLEADGARLTTASGGTVTVKIKGTTKHPRIKLRDADTDDRNPRVLLSALDINKANKQIAHGIDRVLRPIDL